MNTIQILRKQTGLSQREFAEELGIPTRTIQKWEIGQASPPDYVIQMIRHRLEEYKMINMNTVKFIEMLNRLASYTEHEDGEVWIKPFAEANEKNMREHLFYDENEVPHDDDGTGSKMYKIISKMRIHSFSGERTIISTYDELIPCVSVYYIVAPWNKDGCIVVDVNNGEDEPIIISNGEWISESELDRQVIG